MVDKPNHTLEGFIFVELFGIGCSYAMLLPLLLLLPLLMLLVCTYVWTHRVEWSSMFDQSALFSDRLCFHASLEAFYIVEH